MAAPIINTGLSNHLIEYNEYKFGSKCNSNISIQNNLDSSKRTIISKTYHITVTGTITPRRPIPGDNYGFGIQTPSPLPLVNKPGYYPWHQNATVDSEINIIRCKLEEQGKTFRYCGQGSGDIYVNTIDPNTGKYVPDLNFGPKTTLLNLRPTGFNKAWHIEWTIEFTIQNCCSSSLQPNILDYNDPKNRILEYNYDVQYHINREGYTTRTIRGHLTIIPPVWRYSAPLPVLGLSLRNQTTVVHNEISSSVNVFQANLNNIVIKRNGLIDKDSKVLIYLNKLIAFLKTVDIISRSNYLLIIRNFLNTKSVYSINVTDLEVYIGIQYATIFLLVAPGNPNDLAQILFDLIQGSVFPDASFINLNNANYDLISFINLLHTVYDQDIAKYPNTNSIFPLATTRQAIKAKDTFGPYTIDNIGNLQNYETVDQYRDLIEDSIELPHNFARVDRVFNISQDKRTINFSIIDEEQPGFSQVPGYTKVIFRQSTKASGIGQYKWTSTLRGKFVFPKFVNAEKNPNNVGIDLSYSSMQAVSPQGADKNNKYKVYPNKANAYLDFIKVFYQRYAVILLGNRTGTVVNFTDTDGNTRSMKTGSMRTVDFSVDEDITGNDIEFSCSVLLTTSMRDIFQLTGLGLPLIIASDLNVDDNAAVVLQNRGAIEKFINDVTFSNYYDNLKFLDWKSSQLYSTLNCRGSAGLIFDRTYDRPFDVCHDPATKIEHIIPKHRAPIGFAGNYDELKRTKNANTVKGVKWKLNSGNTLQRTLDSILDTLEGVGVGSAYDLFLVENLGIESSGSQGIDVNQPFYSNTSPEDITVGLSNSVDFGVSSDVGTTPSLTQFKRNVEDLVFDKLQVLIGTPPPHRSWLQYSCMLELDTKHRTVRHKTLPKYYSGPKTTFDAEEANYIQGNFGDVMGTGPDDIVGEGHESISVLQNPPQDDIIQFIGSPSNTIILRGTALRTGYPVVPPTLFKYGDQNVYQIQRKFSGGMVDKSNDLIWYGEWEITYITANTPQGRVRFADHPYLTDENEYTPPEVKDIKPAEEVQGYVLGENSKLEVVDDEPNDPVV